MDAEWIDIDSDGTVDTELVDSDGDGITDVQLTDTDGDGASDLMLVDSNADGITDMQTEVYADGTSHILVDVDADGIADQEFTTAAAPFPADTVYDDSSSPLFDNTSDVSYTGDTAGYTPAFKE